MSQGYLQSSPLLPMNSIEIIAVCFIFRAPTDCLQYYTGQGGNFNSFNYNGGTGQYLINQNFNICIRQEAGNYYLFDQTNRNLEPIAQKTNFRDGIV